MKVPLSGVIDCDIHPAIPGTKALLPFMDEFWQDAIVMRNIDRLELASYPPNAPLSGRPDWRDEAGVAGGDLGQLRSQALDHFGAKYAICNCLYGAQAVYNEYLGKVLCSAINDWLVKEWLDREPRLRASIVISAMNPESAAEEIERLAPDSRFVQVLMLAMGEMPLGRRFYWPIYEAAERHQMPIGIHAGSMVRHAPTQAGFPSSLVEDYVGQTQGFAAQLLSFIAEGTFLAHPALKVVLIESGVTWLPSMIWRFTKDWRGIRPEVPWVKEPPADTIRRHVRLTMQPLDAPPDQADVGRILDQIGSDEMLLFATDYPHWQFDGDEALPDGLPAGLAQKILIDNPLATYPRLRESP
jgi:uncharacterized protein